MVAKPRKSFLPRRSPAKRRLSLDVATADYEVLIDREREMMRDEPEPVDLDAELRLTLETLLHLTAIEAATDKGDKNTYL